MEDLHDDGDFDVDFDDSDSIDLGIHSDSDDSQDDNDCENKVTEGKGEDSGNAVVDEKAEEKEKKEEEKEKKEEEKKEEEKEEEKKEEEEGKKEEKEGEKKEEKKEEEEGKKEEKKEENAVVAKGYGDSEGEVEIKNKEEKAEQNTEKMSEAGSSSNHVNFNAIPSNGRTEKSPNDHKETQENAKSPPCPNLQPDSGETFELTHDESFDLLSPRAATDDDHDNDAFKTPQKKTRILPSDSFDVIDEEGDLAVEAAKALTKDDLVKIVKLRNCIIGLKTLSLPSLLIELVLDNIGLTVLPPLKLPHLQSLTLRNNSLRTLKGIEHCYSLESLDVSFNRLTKVTHLETLVNLSTLNIAHNRFTSALSLRTLSINMNLRSVSAEGNPVSLTKGFRCGLSNIVPHLLFVNGEKCQKPQTPEKAVQTAAKPRASIKSPEKAKMRDNEFSSPTKASSARRRPKYTEPPAFQPKYAEGQPSVRSLTVTTEAWRKRMQGV